MPRRRRPAVTDPQGELIVLGPGMTEGYYRKEEANRNSFSGDWFRTGDLFVQDERGYVYIVGRLKDMIRRSGENIAAREVEAALASVEGIAEAAAIGVPDARRRSCALRPILPPNPTFLKPRRACAQ